MKSKCKVRTCLTLLAIFSITSFNLEELKADDKVKVMLMLKRKEVKPRPGMYVGGFYSPSNMTLPEIGSSEAMALNVENISVNITEVDSTVVPNLSGVVNLNVPNLGETKIPSNDKEAKWSKLGFGGEIGYNFGNFSIGALIDYRKYEATLAGVDKLLTTSSAYTSPAYTFIEDHEPILLDPSGIDDAAHYVNPDRVFTTIPLNVKSMAVGTKAFLKDAENRAVLYEDLGKDDGRTNNTLNAIKAILKDGSIAYDTSGVLNKRQGENYDLENVTHNLNITEGQLGLSDGLIGRGIGFKTILDKSPAIITKITNMEKTFLGAVADYNINFTPKFAAFVGVGAGINLVKGKANISAGAYNFKIYPTIDTNDISGFKSTSGDTIYNFAPTSGASTPEDAWIHILTAGSLVGDGGEHIANMQGIPELDYNLRYQYAKLVDGSAVMVDGTSGPEGTKNSILIAKFSEPIELKEVAPHNKNLGDDAYKDELIATYSTSDLDTSGDFNTNVFAAQGRIGIEYHISDFIAPYAAYTARYSAAKDVNVDMPIATFNNKLDISTGKEIVPHKITVENDNDILAKPSVETDYIKTPKVKSLYEVDSSKVALTANISNSIKNEDKVKNVKVSIPSSLDHVFTVGIKFYF
ncbi:hypothetical protein GUI12_02515 [Anaplasmataceae bacterium AB001_6]|nr:hypothetical protein GUI12_02515 [Anaplasmataceae bacterium AB001_6]